MTDSITLLAPVQSAEALPDALAPLLDGSLAPHVFDHRCHVFTAWAAMRRYGIVQGAARFRAALWAYITHLGATEKHHVTITEAMLRLIAHGMTPDLDEPNWAVAWVRFDRRATYLLETSRTALASYYSAACLAEPLARSQFLPPDLLPLPDTLLDAPCAVSV